MLTRRSSHAIHDEDDERDLTTIVDVDVDAAAAAAAVDVADEAAFDLRLELIDLEPLLLVLLLMIYFFELSINEIVD